MRSSLLLTVAQEPVYRCLAIEPISLRQRSIAIYTSIAPSPPPAKPALTVVAFLRQSLVPASIMFIVTVAAVIVLTNINANLAAAGLRIDFGFLATQAGFDVSESLIDYSSRDTYLRALEVGALNTLFVALSALILATMIGLVMGIALTSRNWLLRNLARLYVELLRNVPKLLILVALYVFLVRTLPHIRSSIELPFSGMINNRGLFLPWPSVESGGAVLALALLLWLFCGYLVYRAIRRHQDETGKRYPFLVPHLAAGLLLVCFLHGTGISPIAWSLPQFKGFNAVGGKSISLQFATLVLTLGIYHGGQIAAIVRGGIVATSKGQQEAAQALGLSRLRTMRLIILPQALRVIVPPLGNQYCNLVKNTTVALAIGYSDLMSVMSTSVNQTFRPVELMLLVALFFLVVNLVLSALINWCNHCFKLKTR